MYLTRVEEQILLHSHLISVSSVRARLGGLAYSQKQNDHPTPTMLTSLRRLPLRKFVQASAKNPLLPASRNFQSSGFQAADSMGKLIESGKEGAEFVVSGKL
jgi:hypothetical protein